MFLPLSERQREGRGFGPIRIRETSLGSHRREISGLTRLLVFESNVAAQHDIFPRRKPDPIAISVRAADDVIMNGFRRRDALKDNAVHGAFPTHMLLQSVLVS